jgi:type II secretory pathway component PulC
MKFEPESTPEDRLLNIIENPLAPRTPDRRKLSLDLTGLRDLWDLLKSGRVRQAVKDIPVRNVHKAVLVFSAVLTAVFIYDMTSFGVRFHKRFKGIESGKWEEKSSGLKKSDWSVDFQRTLALAKKHNIFTLERSQNAGTGTMVGDSQATANLKLVGILWSDKPQAMVEDTIDQKTYLLSVGDQIGRLSVQAITKDHVVLGRDDHTWELR